MRFELTTKEERHLTDAIWKTAEGLNEIRAILVGIGDRIDRNWQPENGSLILGLTQFIADKCNRIESDRVSMQLTEDSHWKPRQS